MVVWAKREGNEVKEGVEERKREIDVKWRKSEEERGVRNC